jgi:hypothetical protein
MAIHPGKTKLMLIGTKKRVDKNGNSDVRAFFEGECIEHVSKSKMLGVVIDEHLTWVDHLEYKAKKISQKIGVLKQARPFLSKPTSLCLYNSIIRPHIEYCSTVWCNAAKSETDILYRLQKRPLELWQMLTNCAHCKHFQRYWNNATTETLAIPYCYCSLSIIQEHAARYTV